MRNETTLRRLLLLSAVIALLLMALMFDFVVSSLQIRNSQGFNLEATLVVLFSLFELILVLAGMSVFWYLVSSQQRSRLVSATFLVVGLLVVFALPLLYFLPAPVSLLMLIEFIQPGTYVFQVGGILAVTGLLGLLIRPRLRPVEAIDTPFTEPPGEALAKPEA